MIALVVALVASENDLVEGVVLTFGSCPVIDKVFESCQIIWLLSSFRERQDHLALAIMAPHPLLHV